MRQGVDERVGRGDFEDCYRVTRTFSSVKFRLLPWRPDGPPRAIIDDVLSPLGVLPYITPALSVEMDVPPSLMSFACGCFCSKEASAVVRPGVSFPDEPL